MAHFSGNLRIADLMSECILRPLVLFSLMPVPSVHCHRCFVVFAFVADDGIVVPALPPTMQSRSLLLRLLPTMVVVR
jgi:hypothetical protein